MFDQRAKQATATPPHRAASRWFGDLVTDTRGGILFLGIGIALVLGGVAWNVASLGAAAVWRERATDLADSAAFDAAVWHARGMNLLVMSNLLMAVFMALFTFWRMIVTVLVGLSYLCNWPLFPPCAFVKTLAGQAERVDRRVAQNVSALLQAFTATERALAALTPVVPMALTPETLQNASIRTFSQALLPSKYSQGFGNPASVAQSLVQGDVQRALQERLGPGVSLPVQTDDFDVLCSRAVEAQNWLMGRMLPFDIDRFGPWWQAMTGGDSGFFCSNDAFPPELRQAVRTGLIVTCAVADEPWTCLQRRLARFRPTALAGSAGAGAISTAKPWERSRNGSPFNQVYGEVALPRPVLAHNDHMLALPDLWGRANRMPLSSTGHVAAQAEYFFDCPGKWAECRDHALWRFGHRARRVKLQLAVPQDWLPVIEEVMRRYGGPAWQQVQAIVTLEGQTPARATRGIPE